MGLSSVTLTNNNEAEWSVVVVYHVDSGHG